MLAKTRTRLIAAGIFAAAFGANSPAEARYYVVYWADHVNGTVAGIFEYEDSGGLCYGSGVMEGLMTIYSEPGVPCS